jgi:hypothetical protein
LFRNNSIEETAGGCSIRSHQLRFSDGSATCDGVIQEQNYNRPDHSDDNAVDIDPGDRSGAEERKQEPADKRADNAQDDVNDHTLPGFVDDFAGNETRYQT